MAATPPIPPKTIKTMIPVPKPSPSGFESGSEDVDPVDPVPNGDDVVEVGIAAVVVVVGLDAVVVVVGRDIVVDSCVVTSPVLIASVLERAGPVDAIQVDITAADVAGPADVTTASGDAVVVVVVGRVDVVANMSEVAATVVVVVVVVGRSFVVAVVRT